MRCSTGPSLRSSKHVSGIPVRRTGQPSGCKSPPQVYRYPVDLSSRQSQRSIKKKSFSTRPECFIQEASNGKLPLEQQAIFQIAKPVLNNVRELRIAAVRSLTNGRRSWHALHARLVRISRDAESSESRNNITRLVSRYSRFCLREFQRVYYTLRYRFMIHEEDLATCPLDRSFKPSYLLNRKGVRQKTSNQ